MISFLVLVFTLKSYTRQDFFGGGSKVKGLEQKTGVKKTVWPTRKPLKVRKPVLIIQDQNHTESIAFESEFVLQQNCCAKTSHH